MGIGASATKSKGSTKTPLYADIPILRELQSEIRRLEAASKDDAALDAFIDASQTPTNESRTSSAPDKRLVTGTVEAVLARLGRYLDDIDDHVEAVRDHTGKFGEAVIARCQIYSEDERNVRLSRVRQHIRLVEDLIERAKKRIDSAKTDKTTISIKSLKRQVQELELFKAELRSSGIDSARSTKSERLEHILKDEGGEHVLEDIIQWREEALKLRHKYQGLLDDNERLKAKGDRETHKLQEEYERVINEVSELRQEANEADERAEQADANLQAIQEKLLEERLTHEVEINALKAILERRLDEIAKLRDESGAPGSPEPGKDQIRLSPEGILEPEQSPKSAKTRIIRQGTDSDSPVNMKSKSDSDIDEPLTDNETVQESTNIQDTEDKQQKEVFKIKSEYEDVQENDDIEDGHIKMTLDKLQNAFDSGGEGSNDESDGDVTEEDVKAGMEVKPEITPSMKDDLVVKEKAPKHHTKVSVKSDVQTEHSANTKTKRIEETEEVVCVREGTVKEIIYRRNDGDIDMNLSYYRGVGAVIRTDCPDFEVDSVQCDVVDGLQMDMLPDFVEGERAVSFHIHFQRKSASDFRLQDNQRLCVFVPHRPMSEFEEVCLVQSVEGGDWQPCDPCEDRPTSTHPDIQMVGTRLMDISDVKLVVIAREKSDDIIAGESDVVHTSKFDPTITVNIDKKVFTKRTEVKLLVHHSHRNEMLSAIEMHPVCGQILSCTPFVSFFCEERTRGDVTVRMHLPDDVGEDDCKYTMFSLDTNGWKLADCDWQEGGPRTLVVHLRQGARKYRVLGLELPETMNVEERLTTVRTLHDHTGHHLARLLYRQRRDDPSRAVLTCLRARLVKKGIHELQELGYSLGGYPSSQICMSEGDALTLKVTGEVTAKPVNADMLDLTFYAQKEIATRELSLLPADGASMTGNSDDMVQGFLSVQRRGDSDKVLLGETLHLPLSGHFSDAYLTQLAESATTLSPTVTDTTTKPIHQI